jgi:hypothetical protein
MEPTVPRALLAQQAQMEQMEPLDHKVYKAMLVQQDLKACKAFRVYKAM